MNWQNHSLIRLIIPFTLGMIGANLFIAHMDESVLFILCCIVLAFSFFLIKSSHTYRDSMFGVVAMMFFFLLGMTLYTGKHHRIANSVPQDTTFCQGILAEMPTEKDRSWALNLQQEDGTHILLYIGKHTPSPALPLHGEGDLAASFSTGNKPDGVLPLTGRVRGGLSLGDTILAHIKHLEETENGGGKFYFYRRYLFHHGICATAYTPHGHWTSKPCQSRQSLILFAKENQNHLHHIYEDNGLDQEAINIIEAMTIGRKTDIPKETRTAYAHAGVSHVLALSGFHVGIIVLMLQFFSLKHMLPLRWQWASNLLIAVALWCYALLTGLSPSLVRATLMFTILLLCQSTFRNDLSLNSCALAFFIMLCINPFYLHDIGFQLSFIAVGSIGILGKKLITLASFHNNLAHYAWLITIIAISLISTLFTAPLVAYHFGHVSTLALLSNLLLFPFVYLLMFASILWWVFLWCPPISDLLTTLLNWTATTMNTISETIASIPFSTIEWHPNLATTLLCYTALLALTYFIKTKKLKNL